MRREKREGEIPLVKNISIAIPLFVQCGITYLFCILNIFAHIAAMDSQANSTHVLIIGGGLGGTALAQALRKKGISYDLFERDESSDARSQGWALALHQW
jgi:NADPH-dependent 2,4-dienoyl-CoA reductase/sulfur reductase-like enzyme